MPNNGKPVGEHVSQVVELESYANQKRVGLARELWNFLKDNKKWWLMPLLTILVAFGMLIVPGGSAAGPFILLTLLACLFRKLRVTHAVYTWNQLGLP